MYLTKKRYFWNNSLTRTRIPRNAPETHQENSVKEKCHDWFRSSTAAAADATVLSNPSAARDLFPWKGSWSGGCPLVPRSSSNVRLGDALIWVINLTVWREGGARPASGKTKGCCWSRLGTFFGDFKRQRWLVLAEGVSRVLNVQVFLESP